MRTTLYIKKQSGTVVGIMETSFSEKFLTTVLVLITLGAVAALIHSLIAPESTGVPAEPIAVERQF